MRSAAAAAATATDEDEAGGEEEDDDEESPPQLPSSSEDKVKTMGRGKEEPDDEQWLRKLGTAKAFIDDIPMLDPRRWLDWILDLQETVHGTGLRDNRAVASAALMYRVRSELRREIRRQLEDPRPTIPMLMSAIRDACATPEQMIYAEKQLREIRQEDEEPLVEYLRRFEGWRIVCEARSRAERQCVELRTRLIAGLNTYTARPITADLYGMELDDVVTSLTQISYSDMWDGLLDIRESHSCPHNQPYQYIKDQFKGIL